MKQDELSTGFRFAGTKEPGSGDFSLARITELQHNNVVELCMKTISSTLTLAGPTAFVDHVCPPSVEKVL